MAYASWSVVFGEQPSAAKWNILGTNDASFNDSTGINLQYNNLVGLYNPYKFSTYRNAALTINTTATKITYDTEFFDTNNNFASGTYTAPVAGFYFFKANIETAAAGAITRLIIFLYKNGSEVCRGNDLTMGTVPYGMEVTAFLQLAASDTIEVYAQAVTTTKALDVTTSALNQFSGFLVSKT